MICEPGRRHVVSHLHGLRSFSGSAGPTTIEFGPNFQAMMLEMMRLNSRLIQLMDRRLSAEEKRREKEEAARKAANVPLVAG